MILLLIFGAPAWIPMLGFVALMTTKVFNGFRGDSKQSWTIGVWNGTNRPLRWRTEGFTEVKKCF